MFKCLSLCVDWGTSLSQKTLQRLVNISQTSLTLTAVINALFRASMQAEAVDLVGCLLATDRRLDADKTTVIMRIRSALRSNGFEEGDISPLVFAAGRGNAELAAVLLDHGASLRHHTGMAMSLLAIAIWEPAAGPAYDVIRLLVERGAAAYEFENKHISGLQAAIVLGDVGLIHLLLDAGSDLNYRATNFTVNPSMIGTGITNWYGSRMHQSEEVGPDSPNMPRFVDNIGCFDLAASFCSIPLGSRRRHDDEAASVADEQMALDLCQLIVGFGSRVTLCGQTIASAMILAAARGYTNVLGYLHRTFSPPIEVENGLFSPLYTAVDCRQTEASRLLLELGASPTFRPRSSTPPILHLAAERNTYDAVEQLLRHGVDVHEAGVVNIRPGDTPYVAWEYRDINTRKSVTPFRLSILLEHWDISLLLVNAGAAATATDLHAAVKAGHLQLVERLLEVGGINLDDNAEDGMSAYQVALSLGHGDIAHYLAAAGATIDLSSLWRQHDVAQIRGHLPPWFLENSGTLSPDGEGRSWLENAILSGARPVIQFAFDLHADYYDSGALCAGVLRVIQSKPSEYDDVLQQLLNRRKRSFDTSKIDGVLENTALSLAAWRSRLDVVELLLQQDRHPEWVELGAVVPSPEFGSTRSNADEILSISEMMESQLTTLMERGLTNWHAASRSGFVAVSPVLFAVHGGCDEAASLLLDIGYKADGYTMYAAILEGVSLRLTKRIAEHCYDIDAKCFLGPQSIDSIPAANEASPLPVHQGPEQNRATDDIGTPLCLAVLFDRVDQVKVLLARGADVNAVRGRSRNMCTTALRQAVIHRNAPLVALLLDYGANPNLPAWAPDAVEVLTPLFAAAYAGHFGMVQTLLGRGADPNARTISYGCTPLEAAAEMGRLDIVQLLVNGGSRTDGYQRYAYVNAVYVASCLGYVAVYELLCAQREWTPEDERILQELSTSNSPYHPAELSSEELELLVNGRRRIPRSTLTLPAALQDSGGESCDIHADDVIDIPELTESGADDSWMEEFANEIGGGEAEMSAFDGWMATEQSAEDNSFGDGGITDAMELSSFDAGDINMGYSMGLGGSDLLEEDQDFQLWDRWAPPTKDAEGALLNIDDVLAEMADDQPDTAVPEKHLAQSVVDLTSSVEDGVDWG